MRGKSPKESKKSWKNKKESTVSRLTLSHLSGHGVAAATEDQRSSPLVGTKSTAASPAPFKSSETKCPACSICWTDPTGQTELANPTTLANATAEQHENHPFAPLVPAGPPDRATARTMGYMVWPRRAKALNMRRSLGAAIPFMVLARLAVEPPPPTHGPPPPDHLGSNPSPTNRP
ncbi:hypothetical protein F511_09427 [Dorcoceras hygrometricum]|uniref:Uncharacterized protein n=1 Tax=Dorcoceras hygrometricum TaxID=472368 RepID=A0A2Z7CB80_9LAMI|nr:hypothetical protein F511_09427 [Dorcoceras hygrometricum]